MPPSTRESSRNGALTETQLQLDPRIVPLEAPALDLETPPACEEWAAVARQHIRTDERCRVVDALARHHFEYVRIEDLAAEAGVNVKTARAALRQLRAAGLLASLSKTASSRGHVGCIWLLCDGERPLVRRDGYRGSTLVPRDEPPWYPGMNRAFAGPGTPAPCLLSPSDEELSTAKDEERTTNEQALYDYVERRVAWLERQFKEKIHRGKHRELAFAALRENDDGVRACYEEACKRGTNPLGLFLRMIEDGEHRVRVSSAHPRCTRCEKRKTDAHDRADEIARAGYGHPGTYLVCDACASSGFGLASHRDQEASTP
jgi:hypothetical protein